MMVSSTFGKKKKKVEKNSGPSIDINFGGKDAKANVKDDTKNIIKDIGSTIKNAGHALEDTLSDLNSKFKDGLKNGLFANNEKDDDGDEEEEDEGIHINLT